MALDLVHLTAPGRSSEWALRNVFFTWLHCSPAIPRWGQQAQVPGDSRPWWLSVTKTSFFKVWPPAAPGQDTILGQLLALQARATN